MKHRKLPSHIGVTMKDWRIQKRRELKRTIKAYEDFHIGCAYTPAYEEAKAIYELLQGMKRRLSQEEWGK